VLQNVNRLYIILPSTIYVTATNHRRLPQMTADHYRSLNPNPSPNPNLNPLTRTLTLALTLTQTQTLTVILTPT